MPRNGPKKGSKFAYKRTPQQLELQRAEMLSLIRRGYTQLSIAAKYGLSPQQVSYDYKIVIKQVMADKNKDAEALVAMKLAECEEIKREAWAAWERSKLDAEKLVQKETDVVKCPVCDGAKVGMKGKSCRNCDGQGEIGGPGERTKTTEGRLPGAEYLQTIERCIATECRLLGINAPKKVEMNGVAKAVIDWSALIRRPEGINPVEAKIIEALPAPHTNGEASGSDVD